MTAAPMGTQLWGPGAPGATGPSPSMTGPAPSAEGPPASSEVEVPPELVRSLVGTGGAVINDLRQQAGPGVFICILPPNTLGGPQKARITGPAEGAAKAEALVKQKIEELRGRTPPAATEESPAATEMPTQGTMVGTLQTKASMARPPGTSPQSGGLPDGPGIVRPPGAGLPGIDAPGPGHIVPPRPKTIAPAMRPGWAPEGQQVRPPNFQLQGVPPRPAGGLGNEPSKGSDVGKGGGKAPFLQNNPNLPSMVAVAKAHMEEQRAVGKGGAWGGKDVNGIAPGGKNGGWGGDAWDGNPGKGGPWGGKDGGSGSWGGDAWDGRNGKGGLWGGGDGAWGGDVWDSSGKGGLWGGDGSWSGKNGMPSKGLPEAAGKGGAWGSKGNASEPLGKGGVWGGKSGGAEFPGKGTAWSGAGSFPEPNAPDNSGRGGTWGGTAGGQELSTPQEWGGDAHAWRGGGLSNTGGSGEAEAPVPAWDSWDT